MILFICVCIWLLSTFSLSLQNGATLELQFFSVVLPDALVSSAVNWCGWLSTSEPC